MLIYIIQILRKWYIKFFHCFLSKKLTQIYRFFSNEIFEYLCSQNDLVKYSDLVIFPHENKAQLNNLLFKGILVLLVRLGGLVQTSTENCSPQYFLGLLAGQVFDQRFWPMWSAASKSDFLNLLFPPQANYFRCVGYLM